MHNLQLYIDAIGGFHRLSDVSAQIVTANLRLADWVQIFGDERLTAALLDRLMHHTHILEFTGAGRIRIAPDNGCSARANRTT